MLKRAKYLCGASFSLGALMFATTAAAQGPQTTAVPETVDDGGGAVGLEEIVVTAQKREENSQKVPIAISALSAEQLANQKIDNVNDIASQVPNFQISTPYSEAVPTFSLRGISAVDYSQNQSAPVALYVDEVYKGLPALTSLQVFDVDRLEVLRGPQGTLYGKNTTGGAVNFYTTRPDVDEGFTGYLSAGLGRFNRREASGGVNIPLAEGVLAGRAAFTVNKVRGFVKNLTPGLRDQGSIDDWAMRLSLAFEPTDTFNMLLRYTRSESTPTGFGNILDRIGTGGISFAHGFARDGLGFFENRTDDEGFVRIKNQGASLTTTWDVTDGAALTSVTAYDEGFWHTHEDADNTPFEIVTNDYISDVSAFSQDLRLASTGDGALKWLIGAYFYRDRVNGSVRQEFVHDAAGDHFDATFAPIPNGVNDCLDSFFFGCTYKNSYRQIRRSFALYTQESLEFSPGLTATVGLRYTHDNNRLASYRSDLSYVDFEGGPEIPAFPFFTSPPINQVKNENLSGKIGLDYQINDKTLVYGSVSRGYRGASFNGIALTSAVEVTVANPERLDAFEIGLKTQTSDNRLRVNASAFYYDYRNQQFIDSPDGILQILYNAPKSRLWGGELELMARPVQTLDLRLGASYLNAKYKEINLFGGNQAGNHMILAPEWTFSGAFDWTAFESDAGSVSLHGTTRYTSKIYFNATNTPGGIQDGYFLHDARLTYKTADESIALSAWIRNIANKKYTPFRLDVSAAFNAVYSHRGRPREWGVEATYRF